MSIKSEKFIDLLKQMFEIDKAELDFGIYRIINYKRNVINKFLNEDLQSSLETQIKKIDSNADGIEDSIYSHLTTFFGRYYDEGDFISQRRYKDGAYAIPYNGEEVKLYWANYDQYYIKSSENFKDYSFKAGDKKISFKLVEADTELNNNKSLEGNKYFVLDDSKEFISVNNNELIIKFQFKVLPKSNKQEKLNGEILESILDKLKANPEYADYLLEVQQLRPTDKNKKRTLLEMELSNYTAKNSFDYFIHKDLGGFLRRELDFYIKNEVINLDYYDTTSEKELMTTLAIGKVISNIGKKIIEFLEQIENFQKKLWLKKKFVIDTNYCITLDRIDKKFYKEIIENKKQQNAWKKLFSIEEEITLENINDNKYLLVDTKFFNDEFKEKLIESIEDIDKNCDGLMIHSDNYQALNLIRKQNEKKVQSIYIDPPYNTEHSQILYKNQFRHSSWLTMIADRLDIANNFLSNEFTIGIAIDDYEFINLSAMLNEYYSGKEISNIIVNHHPQGSGGRLSRTHEYHILISDKTSPAYSGEPVENYDEDRSFMRSGTAENNYRLGRWRSFYALLLDEKEGKVIGVEEPIEIGCDYPKEYTIEGYKRVYPINSKGEERVWRSSYETGKQRVENGEIYITEKGTVYQKISHENKRKVLFSNWIDSKYNAGIHGSNLLGNMGLGSEFDYPKSINTVETALWAQTYGKNDSKILDFFI